MIITPHDVETVRRVLLGEISRADAARELTAVQHALLAHSCLAAGNYRRSARKGQYGELLREFIAQLAAPQGGWAYVHHSDGDGGYYNIPEWLIDAKNRLVPTCRQLGLHVANRQGNQLRVTRLPQVDEVVVDANTCAAARLLFNQALEAVEGADQAEAERIISRDAFSEGVVDLFENALLLLPRTAEQLERAISPDNLVRLHAGLGELLRQHHPDRLEHPTE